MHIQQKLPHLCLHDYCKTLNKHFTFSVKRMQFLQRKLVLQIMGTFFLTKQTTKL